MPFTCTLIAAPVIYLIIFLSLLRQKRNKKGDGLLRHVVPRNDYGHFPGFPDLALVLLW